MNLSLKIQLIGDYDKTINKILTGQTFLDEIDTPIKLMKYDLTFKELDDAFNELMPNRWPDLTEEKKKSYYENAKEVNKNKTKNPLNQYFDLIIKKIQLYPNKNDSMVKIKLENATIELTKEKIISSREFRTLYYLESKGLLLPDLPQNIWAKLLTLWTKKFGETIIKKEVTEDEIVVEKIVSEIETFTLVDELKKCISYGRAYLENEIVFVPANAIELIIQKNKWNFKQSKVAFFLEKKLAGNSEPKRAGKRLIRFWKFKKECLDLDYGLVLDNEND